MVQSSAVIQGVVQALCFLSCTLLPSVNSGCCNVLTTLECHYRNMHQQNTAIKMCCQWSWGGQCLCSPRIDGIKCWSLRTANCGAFTHFFSQCSGFFVFSLACMSLWCWSPGALGFWKQILSTILEKYVRQSRSSLYQNKIWTFLAL